MGEEYQGNLLENIDAYYEIAKDKMTLEEANQIFTEYHASIDFSEEYMSKKYAELVTRAMRYAKMRMDWSTWDKETRQERDYQRTNLHNLFLNSVTQYASYQKRNGGDCHWFEMLGQGIEPDEVDSKRKRIGDWACYIALFVALNKR